MRFFSAVAGIMTAATAVAKTVAAATISTCVTQPIRVLNTAMNLTIDAGYCYVPSFMSVFNPLTGSRYFPTAIADLFNKEIPNCAPLSNATNMAYNYAVCDNAGGFNCQSWPFDSSAVLAPSSLSCDNFAIPPEVSECFYSLAEKACNMTAELQKAEYSAYDRNVWLIIGGVTLGFTALTAACCFFCRQPTQQDPERRPFVVNNNDDNNRSAPRASV